MPILLQVSEIEIDYYALRLSVFRSINASCDQSKLLSQPILNNMQNLRSSFSDYRKYFTNEEDKRLYALIDNSLKEYLVAVKKTQHMLERGEFHNSPEKDKMIKLGARLAEDLESAEQSLMMKRIGCDLLQGFFYSKPVTSVEIERIYVDNNSNLFKFRGLNTFVL